MLSSDNVDKKKRVRDLRSDHQGQVLHMFSILVGRSRTPGQDLSHAGQVSNLMQVPAPSFLPCDDDVNKVKESLVTIVSRVLTCYFTALAPFAKVVPKHIPHAHSSEISKKSEVYTLDVLMKDECKHSDMIEIMQQYQEYLGEKYHTEKKVVSGGDQCTCERQQGAQKHMMCGNTVRERLGLLEPVCEDWHCLVTFIQVSGVLQIETCTLIPLSLYRQHGRCCLLNLLEIMEQSCSSKIG